MSLTRPLTRPLTRKISRAELTQGYGGSFSPLLLNPYLLFDARESMVGTLENPTLDLNPALPETLDVITATRSGTATYTDPDGNIATAAADTVRVDYTQGAELTPTKYQRIENTDFSSWSHARTSGTANAAISPDGQNNATYVEQNAGQTNAGSIYRFDAAFTGVFTLSVYAKKKEKDFVVLYDSNVGRTYFNLDTGTVGTIAAGNTANIEDAGNGWFRCSTTFTASSGTVKAFYVGDNDNNSVVTDSGGIYVWGPQLEEGTTASDFVENTTGSPKFIASATYGPRVPMILVEPSATNLVAYSEDFSNSTYEKTRVAITTDDAISPDGNTSADKLSATVTTGSHFLKIDRTVSSGASYTFSVFVKKGEYDWVNITLFGTGWTDSTKSINFNASTGEFGTVTSGVTHTSESLANGWYRLSITNTTVSTSVAVRLYACPDDNILSFTGDGTSGLYLWGAQFEAGSVATSIIPTSGSTVTRQADALVISGSDFTDFFNGSEGTFYIEAVDRQATGSSHAYLGGQDTTRLFLYNYDDIPNLITYDGANDYQLGSIVSNQLFRGAVSYKTGVSPAPSVLSLSFNGTTTSDQPYSENFSTTNIFKIGSGYSKVFSGHFRRIIYWPYHSDRL